MVRVLPLPGPGDEHTTTEDVVYQETEQRWELIPDYVFKEGTYRTM